MEFPITILPKARKVIRAIDHPVRQGIVSYLILNDGAAVQEIENHTRLGQNVVSSHLALLRQAGVIHYKRENQFHKYSVDKVQLSIILSYAEQLSKLLSIKSPQHVKKGSNNQENTAPIQYH